MDIQKRAQALVKKHKTYRAASDATGIDCGHLHRIASGQRRNVSLETLRKLGLIKEAL